MQIRSKIINSYHILCITKNTITNPTNKKIKIVNVRLPEKITKWLDSLVKRGLFSSKSDAVRELVREYVINNRKGADK